MEFQFIHRETYTDNDGEFPSETINTKAISFKDGTTWHKVVDQFLDFLGGVYGYNIRDQVKYESFADRLERLTEDYPGVADDDFEDPFSTQGREFN